MGANLHKCFKIRLGKIVKRNSAAMTELLDVQLKEKLVAKINEDSIKRSYTKEKEDRLNFL